MPIVVSLLATGEIGIQPTLRCPFYPFESLHLPVSVNRNQTGAEFRHEEHATSLQPGRPPLRTPLRGLSVRVAGLRAGDQAMATAGGRRANHTRKDSPSKGPCRVSRT